MIITLKFNKMIKVGSNGSTELNLLDLELMHQFSTSTSLSLHHEPTVNRLWSISVPLLGFSHDFVMHGILALAALHLASLRRERRDLYLSQAVAHHQEGLKKATPALSHVSEENVSAIYTFSALTLIYTFASAQNKDDFILVGDAGIAEWVVLSRQTYSIIRSSADALYAGPLGPMFTAGVRRSQMQDQLTEDGLHVPQADHLTQLFAQICETTEDDWKRKAYELAIRELLKVFRVVYSQPPETLEATDVYIWAYRIEDEFLALLKEQTQEALVIMAFFAATPQQLLDTKKHWFLEGFSKHLISRIYPLIDEQHLSWIQWSLKEIGWDPQGDAYATQVDHLQGTDVSWDGIAI
jgi:hypothetical protein